jgi:hypothetical protein
MNLVNSGEYDLDTKRIYAISDIHTEFYKSASEIFDTIQWQPATHLILAGDIGVVCTKSVFPPHLGEDRREYSG